MKIVMVGDSAVGKTTFMMSTYGLMVDGEINGFRVKCKDETAHQKLIRAYNDFRTDGVYPPATVHMSSYEYDFFSDGDWVMTFSLTDIRGESIHEYDVKDLSNKLRDADAMMLFLNGYDIVNGEDVSAQIDDISILLNNCFTHGDREKIIMVLFSQMDRLDELGEEEINLVCETVDDIKQMTDRNDKISFQIVPTGCSLDCMMDLDFAMITLMLFGYSTEVLKRRKAIEDELNQIKELYGTEDGVLKRIGRDLLEIFWFDTKRDEARKRAKELEMQTEEYDKMVDKFNKLSTFWDKYELGTSYKIKRRESARHEGNPFKL